MPRNPDANDETLWVLELACFELSRVCRVKKEASAPHMRLVCNHLQLSFLVQLAFTFLAKKVTCLTE
jgi:hypothetical protein